MTLQKKLSLSNSADQWRQQVPTSLSSQSLPLWRHSIAEEPYQLRPSWFCLDLHELLFSYPFFLSPNRQPFLSLPNMPLTPLPGWSPPCEDDIVEEPVVLGLGNPVAAADSNLAAPLQDKVQVSSLTRHTTLFPFLKKALVCTFCKTPE